ncbi:tripartite tricarboxylate transporter substrate binding protein [Pseudorhodoferax sp. Leaf267]|uniref:Bug family tripartite tricarboxylate transporter substrate binding protein n=1 Tax=Pseudorhodoferax sp. Leaf267 TaxID=1736316 RepID=UPI0006F9A61B|nr:tripartite tricarboxylate transporter substrate-binding protein [Pseudorhodoferax sp. Leaf267]KQP14187.1 hypothetical protein ASF43_15255 [Pseudorhodoferax sp. Leaf267]
MQRRDVLRCALALAPSLAGDAMAELPERPIRIVVPSPPGQGGDTLSRLLAAKVTEQSGRTVIVENRPGGDMIIGATQVAQAAPDGTTLLFSGTTVSSAAGALHAKLPYDPLESFAPVVGVSLVAYVLAVRKDLPVYNVPELIALARSRPGQLSFGSGNQSGRMAGELFKSMAGIDLLHVPYQGVAKAAHDLAAGRIDMMFNGTMTTRPLVDSGQARVLGTSARKRDPLYPDAAPIDETLRGYSFFAWTSLVAPRGTPQPVVQALNTLFTAALSDPAIQARFAEGGLVPWPVPPAELAANARADLAKWRRLVQQAGIVPGAP